MNHGRVKKPVYSVTHLVFALPMQSACRQASAELKATLLPLRLLALALVLLVLSGCSATRLAYDNADWLLKRMIDDYVELSGPQSRELDGVLDQHLGWHCRTQLPAYLAWLDKAEQTVTAETIKREEIAARVTEVEAFMNAIAVEITPSTVALLRDLNDQQVEAMQKKMERKNRERERKFVSPSLPEQVIERANRLEKRLHRWLGDLNEDQEAQILAWSNAMGDQNAHWLQNRRHWQQELLKALEQRKQPQFEQQVTNLLQARHKFYSEDYRKRHDEYREAAIDLAVRILSAADENQQAHLRKSISRLRDDIQHLRCD